MPREKVLTVSKKDLEITATTGSGKGGQHQNKTATKVRILHRPSGAAAVCNSGRSQHQNKRTALVLLSKNPKFLKWVYEKVFEDERRQQLEQKVDELMDPKNIIVENGRIVKGGFIKEDIGAYCFEQNKPTDHPDHVMD